MNTALGAKIDDTHDLASYRDRALEDLIDLMMQGREYPRRASRPQINLLDILCECDQSLLAEAIVVHILYPRCSPSLEARIESIVRDCLIDSEWVVQRAEELWEEETIWK